MASSFTVTHLKYGNGSFGNVHLAQDEKTGMCVAIKEIRFHAKYKLEDARKEISILKTLSGKHACALELITHFMRHDYTCIVTEKCETDMLDFVNAHPPLSQAMFWNIAQQMTDAIAFIQGHNIIHCDIKLDNWCLKYNTLSVIKLIDFGHALRDHDESVPIESRGTLSYLSPEAFYGIYNDHTDMWGIGMCLYAMTHKNMPFQYEKSRIGDLTPDLVASCIKVIQNGVYFEEDTCIGNEEKHLITQLLAPCAKHRIYAHDLIQDFKTVYKHKCV